MQRPTLSSDTRDSVGSIGLVAAWGRYPIVVAETLKRLGHRVSCLAVKDHANPCLQEICDDFAWIGCARLGAAIRHFRRWGITEATMAGKFHKVILYKPWLAVRHLPDWRTIRTFYPHFVAGKRDRKDDTLLLTLVEAFAKSGIRFAPATDYIPELLVRPGPLSGAPLTTAEEKDVVFGWSLAKAMGRLDVGQSVCVKGQSVLAVEAIEGTDACIERAGTLCRKEGFTVVKVAKPQQDMRFDVPTIGLGTLQTMAAAGARVLAVEAGRTILLDEEQFLATARQLRIKVVARHHAEPCEAAA